jgi:hypothetical protein
MRATLLEQSLGRFRGLSPILDQPAKDDGGATSTPSFTVDIDFSAKPHLLLNELHPLANVIQGRRLEVDCRQPKLLDTQLSIKLRWPSILLAHVDHRADSQVK